MRIEEKQSCNSIKVDLIMLPCRMNDISAFGLSTKYVCVLLIKKNKVYKIFFWINDTFGKGPFAETAVGDSIQAENFINELTQIVIIHSCPNHNVNNVAVLTLIFIEIFMIHQTFLGLHFNLCHRPPTREILKVVLRWTERKIFCHLF